MIWFEIGAVGFEKPSPLRVLEVRRSTFCSIPSSFANIGTTALLISVVKIVKREDDIPISTLDSGGITGVIEINCSLSLTELRV